MKSRTPLSVAAQTTAATLLSFFLLACSGSPLSAQAVSFSYAQTTFPTSGVFIGGGVTLDSAGNLYSLNFSSVPTQLVKVPSGGGSAVVISGVQDGVMAVDAVGNLFTIQYQQVLRFPASGGTPTLIGSFAVPGGVALDGQSNVYVIDSCPGPTCTLSKVASDGNGAQTQIPLTDSTIDGIAADKLGDVFLLTRSSSGIDFGFLDLPVNGGPPITVGAATYVTAFTVDAAGDIFFAVTPPRSNSNTVSYVAEIPAGGGAPITLASFGFSLTGLAVDSQGTVYVGELFGVGVAEIQRTGSVNFQNVNACPAAQNGPPPCTETAILSYNVTGGGTLGTPNVINTGNSTSDFSVAGGSTCTGSVATGSTCSVAVSFTPQAGGLRSGTVQVVDGSGNVLATVGVTGNGISPGGTGTPFITSQTPGPLRNDYTGLVGFEFTVGGSPIQVYSLGFLVNPSGPSTSTLKLVQSNGADMPGGGVVVASNYNSANPPYYAYADLGSPITLSSNTSYYLLAQEYAGSSSWYNFGPVTSTSAATVVGPSYTGQNGNYVTAAGLNGEAYVPLNFLYAPVGSTAISVKITSPVAGVTLSGTAPISVSTTGAVTSLQVQVDGFNKGAAVSASGTLSLDTTALTDGTHSLTVIATDAQSDTAASAPVSINVSNAGGSFRPFINSQAPGPLRNNYSGFVGFEFTTGTTPVQITSVGRYVAPGDSASHLLKLVQANGIDLPGGSATVSTAGVPAGQYAYAPLASPITLPANTTAYLLSQETGGGDQWYDYGPVTSTAAAIVLGPVYTDAANRYVTVNYVGASFVPLNFIYAPATGSSLSVTITLPSQGGLLSGNSAISVATTGAAASLQLQVDGANEGPAVPASGASPYTLNLDTTLLVNGSHSLTIVASDAQLNTVTSAPVMVTVNNSVGAYESFVTGETAGSVRNNYTGFVGFSMTTGSTPVVVSFLGRYVTSAGSATHLLKLVSGNGVDVPGGSASVSLVGATPGSFTYAALPSPVTLQANTSYFLVSQETAGGDQWRDYAPVTTTSVAGITGPVYTDAGGHYVPVPGAASYSYVPVSFLYGSNVLSVIITSPQAGAVVSGSNVPVAVTTTGSFTSLQLQVDGTSQGSAVSSGPLTLNTAGLSTGAHTLKVVISQGTTASAVSAGVIVTVSNGGATPTSFITGETPSTLRNNYSGFVGTAIKVGSTPLSVTALGRFDVTGNSGIHTLKLVQSNGADVPGSSVSVSMTGGTAGQFVYTTLGSPVALLANTTYYLVSQEASGGDMWYDFEPVTGTSAAQILGPTYTDAQGNYVLAGGFPGYSYVPVSFQYQ